MPTYSNQDAATLDSLKKNAAGIAARKETFLLAEEPIGSGDSTRANRVFMKNPPAVPPAASDDVVTKHYAAADGGDGVVRLTRDIDDADGKALLAFPTFRANFSSGANPAAANETLKYWLDDMDGAGYGWKLFLPDGTWVPRGSMYKPEFDREAGVLRTAVALPCTCATEADSPYIVGYRQTGETLDQFAENIAENAVVKVEENLFCGNFHAQLTAAGITPG